MDDLLSRLGAGGRVLDLGAGEGSFLYGRYPCRIIAVDTKRSKRGSSQDSDRLASVVGTASALPLRDNSINVVVGSHLFEHLADPASAVREVARVLRPDGVLFTTIPDGRAWSDRLYRLWTLGGGHVQRFSFAGFQTMVEQNTDLELLYARRLYASFSFLRPCPEIAIHLPRRSQLLKYVPGWMRDVLLGLVNFGTRLLDSLLGTHTSIYGWACYFGKPAAHLATVNRREYVNVCSGCGAGHPRASLRRSAGLGTYRCPQCRKRNPFFGGWISARITAREWDEQENMHDERLTDLSLATPSLFWWPSSRAAGRGIPTINPHGVVNAASYKPLVSAGSLVAIFGTNLSGPELALRANGTEVPLSHVSEHQLTGWIPACLHRMAIAFRVMHGAKTGPENIVTLGLTSPGLFSRDGTGQGIAATIGTPRAGGRIALLATGLGPVTSDGRPTRSCRVLVAGTPVKVDDCRLRPRGRQPGLFFVRIRLPRRLSGACPVQLIAGGRASNILRLERQPGRPGDEPHSRHPERNAPEAPLTR